MKFGASAKEKEKKIHETKQGKKKNKRRGKKERNNGTALSNDK
jgi:hypothetical protein